MPPLTKQKVLSRGRPVPPTALGHVPLKPLPQVLGKAVSRTPGSGVPGGRVSPHAPLGRVTCPLLWAAALGAVQPCGVSLTTGGIAPASLRYDHLSPVARVAGPRCLAGDPLLGCVPARLSPVVAMAPGDVWSPMQPGRARTCGLGVPLLPLARRVRWVAQACLTLGVWFLAPCPSAALGACACAVSGASWRLFTGAHALCSPCTVSVATWRLFTGARPVCGMHVLFSAS